MKPHEIKHVLAHAIYDQALDCESMAAHFASGMFIVLQTCAFGMGLFGTLLLGLFSIEETTALVNERPIERS